MSAPTRYHADKTQHKPNGGQAVRPLAIITCKHDGDGGQLRDGRPRCPMCRREQWAADRRREWLAEQAAAREAAELAARPDLFGA